MTEGWDTVAEHRRALARLAARLTPREGDTASLWHGRTVHQVMAHLVAFVAAPPRSFVSSMVRSRGHFHPATDLLSATWLGRPLDELARILRDRADRRAPLPLPAAMMLTDVVIHTQDICRPLERDVHLRPEVIAEVLDFITTHRLAPLLVDRSHIAGLRLVATDLPWSWGDGPEVRGPAEALIMMCSGRLAATVALDGPGVSRLSRRS